MVNKIDNLVLIKIPNKNDYNYNGKQELEEFIIGKEYKVEIDENQIHLLVWVKDFIIQDVELFDCLY